MVNGRRRIRAVPATPIRIDPDQCVTSVALRSWQHGRFRLHADQLVVDASTGSTAISEAWFARLLGLRFVAVVPKSTEPGKLKRIRALGGEFELT